MTSGLRQNGDNKRRLGTLLAFIVGGLLLLGTWTVMFWLESLFTESHLVGYYCCVTEADLPARGTLTRMVSDFFRVFPGRYLLSVIFVVANLWLYILSLRRNRGRNAWWLPFLFIACGIAYALASIFLVSVSWSISDYVVGPTKSAYKGLNRAWYGIVLHLTLWAGYFFALSRVAAKFASKQLVVGD